MKIVIIALMITMLSAASALSAGTNVPQAQDISSIPPEMLTQLSVSKEVKPFGYGLFSGKPDPQKGDIVNPNYIIVPGDKVVIQIWGAQNFNASTTVDPSGNIFIPDVGPIRVAGLKQSQLNQFVQQKVNSVYKDNVEIYTVLKGGLPVSVFVTGAVLNPGRHVGVSTDSVIDYIAKAGGIQPDRGSYRDIQIIRNNQPIYTVDLYDFLLKGTLPQQAIEEGDTILVTEKGSVVTAEGNVVNNYKFEFKDSVVKGADLIAYTSPKPEATHATIIGTRNGRPYKAYLSAMDFVKAELKDGDDVVFQKGVQGDRIKVAISGIHSGPEALILPLNSKLSDVINKIKIDENISDKKSVYIKRRSVAEKQKTAIQDSVVRLQETLLLSRATGATTSNTPAIGEGELKILDRFVEKALVVEPEGRLVVTDDNGKFSDISLEDGDEIVIPQKTDIVMVNGEVLMPKAVVWDSSLSYDDYIEKAGGFSDRANESKILIIRANGESVTDYNADVKPGDEIMVLPEVKLNDLEVTSKVVDIIYKIAVAAVIPLKL